MKHKGLIRGNAYERGRGLWARRERGKEGWEEACKTTMQLRESS
jgi:hypothetical protein